MQVLLVGNPNAGKTTLFNALTGEHQRVGNWPGVTVEKKSGAFQWQTQTCEITDLPGIYSLSVDESASEDARIAANAIATLPCDVLINVVDACHLERHLYLTTQLLEWGKPLILVLTMADLAQKEGIQIDKKRLSEALKCPVFFVKAHRNEGIDPIKDAIFSFEPGRTIDTRANNPLVLTLLPQTQAALHALSNQLETDKKISRQQALYQAYRELERLSSAEIDDLDSSHDLILADARYTALHALVESVQTRASRVRERLTAKIDRIVLNRFFALPIFLAVMYSMFLIAINIGGAFQDFFDITTHALCVDGVASLLMAIHAPFWLIALLANGVGIGINTTVTFIPVMLSLFFCLSFLESSGYMARAAFVIDKLMRFLGLPGKSFVPMVIGFGCNVPAIMAARTLDSDRDRLLTVLMSPFMSCSARLAIYAVFVAAFFRHGGQNIVFSLYLTGIVIAVFTGFLLRKTILEGQASPLILELPVYHWPSLKTLYRDSFIRLAYFLRRAGRIIIPVCILLGILNALTIKGGISFDEAHAQSLLSLLGQSITPILSPMGIHPDNWPATVGLLTGMLAKEVVIGTLNALYTASAPVLYQPHIWSDLQGAFWSIPHNLSHLGEAFLNPVLASAPDNVISKQVYGMMSQRFDGPAGAFSYLLFVLLYIPCVSTMAVIAQETNRRWMWFSLIWSLLIAYSVAVIFYQIARWSLHPLSSFLWITSLCLALIGFILGLKYKSIRSMGYAFGGT